LAQELVRNQAGFLRPRPGPLEEKAILALKIFRMWAHDKQLAQKDIESLCLRVLEFIKKGGDTKMPAKKVVKRVAKKATKAADKNKKR